ncbi:class II 3-deoxy-7-phosphoheptulonate synthase [Melittangium boletus]|uniref:class II 3-deoxy-7-phosphoheptulonate synthase n=1 Tax=Melittangium boletus TaxID=83453 RepID=UPI000BB3E4DC
MMNRNWTPGSWRNMPVKHIPADYPDPQALARVERELAHLPALVSAEETRRLRAALGQVAEGKAFLLQGGDCAESFQEFTPGNVRDTLRLLLQMAVVLTFAKGRPVVKIGRIAGQFAKPRSSPVETRGAITLPAYRGDNINGMGFTPQERTPNPERLLKAHQQSSATLELVRAFAREGYEALSDPRHWKIDHPLAAPIQDSLGFMRSLLGNPEEQHTGLDRLDFYTSHEALLLNVEEALTRLEPATGEWYDTSAHMLWIGERTRQLDGGHVEFMRGIQNPIGLKCGPGMDPDELLRLMDVLNPQAVPGKLVLIGRFGADKAAERLPRLMAATRRDGRPVVWSIDPMHGNTHTAANGYKTRPFERILSEVRTFTQVATAEGVHPGGLHLEMTGQDVTECLGGACAVSEADLSRRYLTHCDPRLNADQALQLAFLVAEHLQTLRPAPAQAA